MSDPLRQLQTIVGAHRRIVFFGGAGVSTASGIPDFRSREGLYAQRFDYPPEEMLSHRFFIGHREEFFRFYREKILCPGALPNAAHHKLAELEQAGKLLAVVTQNIDGLHQKAGSKNVLELHGSIHRNYCEECGKRFGLQVREQPGVPRCACGGFVRPDVVLYGETLDEAVLRRSQKAIRQCDLLIIGGTSLAVYPAAGLVQDFCGDALVIINRGEIHRESRADLVVDDDIARVLGSITV